MGRENDWKAMGARLREAREYLGFSQQDVAKYLRVPRSALTDMEAGTRKVDALELKKLASLYERSVTFFTDEEHGEDVAHLVRKVKDLSPEDRAELGRFADYLRSRKKRSRRQ